MVELTLKRAFDDGKRFRVVVVDSRPMKEGVGLLRRLMNYGLECTYVLINAVSSAMAEVTKVFLGASAMLSNGNVISRTGTAAVAMLAHRFRVPTMVCCETYKFDDRCQLDSICYNELGDPSRLADDGLTKLKQWESIDSLKLLNLRYDLMPIEFVTLVITEVGHVPPTSVPVIIREFSTDVTQAER